MSLPHVVSREEWLAARGKLLDEEKALTRHHDQVNAELLEGHPPDDADALRWPAQPGDDVRPRVPGAMRRSPPRRPNGAGTSRGIPHTAPISTSITTCPSTVRATSRDTTTEPRR